MLKYQGIALLTLCLVGFAAASQSKDYGQYNVVSPAIRSWIKGLTGYDGIPCCAIADGVEPDAWEMEKDHYRVKLYGVWFSVPDKAVIKSANRVGHALVWLEGDEDGDYGVRCFLPGPQS